MLKGSRHMVAMQIAHEPVIRQVVRNIYYDRCKMTCAATKKGMKEIDESHPCYTVKYLKNKPIRDLSNDTFLHLQQVRDSYHCVCVASYC